VVGRFTRSASAEKVQGGAPISAAGRRAYARTVPRFLFAVIALFLLLASTADAAAARTCRSGHTAYKRDGVRVFWVADGYDNSDYYACGPRTRKPVYVTSVSEAYGALFVVGRRGDKVLFRTSTSGEGGGDYATVGWVDVRASIVRSGELAGQSYNNVLDLVVAKDGGMAVAVANEEDGDAVVRVGYLARASKRGRLRGEQALAIAGEGYVRRSLAFAGASLRWKADRARSVPLSGEPLTCTAGATVAEGAGARLFELFQGLKDTLAACSAGETTPRKLASSDVGSQGFWTELPLKRAGERAALMASRDGIVVLDGGRVSLTRPDGIEALQDVALGATGPVVFAGTTQDTGQEVISLLSGQRLATQGGKIKPGTLAIGDRVTWETTDGVPQSAPLTGETTLDCTVGSTLHARDGLRVFELLGASETRLLACVPGATAPLQLLTAPSSASWRIFEAGREDGRFAVVAASESRGAEARFISFDADDAVTAVPRSSLVGIKDVALAPDGRSAFALRAEGKWRIVAYTGGVERVPAKPSDGVQAGSLAIDGARLVWRNLSGAERSVVL
jgi:hypothetical protein